MTTPSLRAKTNFDHDTGATGGWVVTKPAGTVSGDVLVAFIGAIGTTVTFTPPSGWTLLAAETSNANINYSVYYKVAGGSEPANYTWTPSIGAKGSIQLGAYIDVDNTTPIDAHNNGLNSTGTVTTVPVAVTVVTTGSDLLTAAFGRHAFAAAHTTTTSDGSDVEQYDHGSTSGSGFDYVHAVYDSARSTTSGAATRTITSSGTENAYAWHAVALRPAAAALTGRIYRMAVDVPAPPPALRGRIYRMGVRAPAAAGGKTGRIYRMAVVVPAAGGASGKSGFYAAAGGSLGNVTISAATNGELT
jgi:hypothetical protein